MAGKAEKAFKFMALPFITWPGKAARVRAKGAIHAVIRKGARAHGALRERALQARAWSRKLSASATAPSIALPEGSALISAAMRR
jgi:O-acetyl-ADP-ribose deacetylase (regulator of RNase III)